MRQPLVVLILVCAFALGLYGFQNDGKEFDRPFDRWHYFYVDDPRGYRLTVPQRHFSGLPAYPAK